MTSMTKINEKTVVSVVSSEIPLGGCPVGTRLFIKKDNWNRYDEKALSVLVKHKVTGKWTFIGYVAANSNYIPEGGISNALLYDLLDPVKLAANGTVVDKIEVTFPYGSTATALIVEVDPVK